MLFRSSRRIAVLFAAGLLAAIPVRTLAADPFEINVIIPLTGGASFLGKAEQISLATAEQVINKAGGIHGRPVKFVFQDDQTNPQVGVQLLNGLLAKNVPIVMGSTLTAICGAMAPLVKDGPVLWCFSNAFHPAEGGYVYSSSISTYDEIAAGIRYIHDRGWHKIAVLASNDASGQDNIAAIEEALKLRRNAGSSIVSLERFNLGDISVSAQISRIKASGAQVIYGGTTGTPFATILRGVAEAGLDIPIMTGAGNETYAQMKAYASFLPKELYFDSVPSMSPDELPNGAVKRSVTNFVNAFKAAGVQPDVGTNQPWDTAFLIVEAFKKLGTNATAAQLRNYFDNARGFVGINGQFDFKTYPKRGLGPEWVIIQRWDPAKESFVGVSKPGGAPI